MVAVHERLQNDLEGRQERELEKIRGDERWESDEDGCLVEGERKREGAGVGYGKEGNKEEEVHDQELSSPGLCQF